MSKAGSSSGPVVYRVKTRWGLGGGFPRSEVPSPEAMPAWAWSAAWFAVVASLLELGCVFARIWGADGGLLRKNSNLIWMLPCANLTLFVAAGLAVAVASRALPRVGSLPSTFVLCILTVLSPLLAIPGLKAVGGLSLAFGASCWIAPWVDRHSRGFRKLVGRTLPIFLLVLIGLMLGKTSAGVSAAGALGSAPNVILIVMDTVRAKSTSLHGYERDTTPNLAALAGRGVRFERAVSTAPWTLPSHASMFTGRHAGELSVDYDRPLSAKYPTLAEYLAGRGYATGGFVANTFFCSREYGLGRGFSHYEDYAASPLEIVRSSALGWLVCGQIGTALDHLYPALGMEARHPLEVNFYRKDAARVGRDALRWVSAQRGRPFFAFLNYMDAHDPYLLPEGAHRKFGRPPETLAETRALRAWGSHAPPPRTAENLAMARDAYDDCLAALDDQIGRLFRELERRGLMDNTVVIVTSDHGEHFGEHQFEGRSLFGHGVSLYQPEIHVPLLVVGPGKVPAGLTVREPVSLRDLPATVVDLLGLNDGSPFPGFSLAQTWRAGRTGDEPSPPPRSPLISELFGDVTNPAVRRDPDPLRDFQKAVVADGYIYHQLPKGREELYDLAGDPEETHDLAPRADSVQALDRFRTLDGKRSGSQPETSVEGFSRPNRE